MTAATAVTEAATAWPEGNEAPLVATSDPGGRARSYTPFNVPMKTSDTTIAETNAATCHQRRRNARNPAITSLIGSVTTVSPMKLKPFAASVRYDARTDSIVRRKARSHAPMRARGPDIAIRTKSAAVARARTMTTVTSRRGVARSACSSRVRVTAGTARRRRTTGRDTREPRT